MKLLVMLLIGLSFLFAGCSKEEEKAVEKEVIEKKSAFKKLSNVEGYSIAWQFKPNSFHIDNDVQYYIYNVIEVDTQFRPFYGFYSTDLGVQSGANDSSILILDKTFLIKNNAGQYKIFKKIENYQGRFKSETCYGESGAICSSSYSWGPISAYTKILKKTFSIDSFIPYDENALANPMEVKKFTSDVRYEEYSIFNSVSEIGEIQGVRILSQESAKNGTSLKRNYLDTNYILEESTISNVKTYGFYSNTPLSYKQIEQFLQESNVYYSTSGNYPRKIVDDGVINNEKIKFFIAGKPDKLSVNIDFLPSSEEEGKKTFIYMLLYDDK